MRPAPDGEALLAAVRCALTHAHRFERTGAIAFADACGRAAAKLLEESLQEPVHTHKTEAA